MRRSSLLLLLLCWLPALAGASRPAVPVEQHGATISAAEQHWLELPRAAFAQPAPDAPVRTGDGPTPSPTTRGERVHQTRILSTPQIGGAAARCAGRACLQYTLDLARARSGFDSASATATPPPTHV